MPKPVTPIVERFEKLKITCPACQFTVVRKLTEKLPASCQRCEVPFERGD